MSISDADTPPTSTFPPATAGSSVAQPLDGRLRRAGLRAVARDGGDEHGAPVARHDGRGGVGHARVGRDRVAHRLARAAGLTTTLIGDKAPGPVMAAAAWKPWRASWSDGNWSSPPVPVCMPSTGSASATRIADVETTASTGWRMTAPSSPSRRRAARLRVAPPGEAPRPRHPPAEQQREQRRGAEHRHGDDEHRAERHRADRLVVNHPQPGERHDHGEPGESTASPEVAIATKPTFTCEPPGGRPPRGRGERRRTRSGPQQHQCRSSRPCRAAKKPDSTPCRPARRAKMSPAHDQRRRQPEQRAQTTRPRASMKKDGEEQFSGTTGRARRREAAALASSSLREVPTSRAQGAALAERGVHGRRPSQAPSTVTSSCLSRIPHGDDDDVVLDHGGTEAGRRSSRPSRSGLLGRRAGPRFAERRGIHRSAVSSTEAVDQQRRRAARAWRPAWEMSAAASSAPSAPRKPLPRTTSTAADCEPGTPETAAGEGGCRLAHGERDAIRRTRAEGRAVSLATAQERVEARHGGSAVGELLGTRSLASQPYGKRAAMMWRRSSHRRRGLRTPRWSPSSTAHGPCR